MGKVIARMEHSQGPGTDIQRRSPQGGIFQFPVDETVGDLNLPRIPQERENRGSTGR